MNAFRLFRAAVLIALLAGAARAENWPQWRGPNNDGISTEKKLPTTWSKDKNVAWKLTLPGPGSSTPVVWGDKIFLTAQDGKKLVLMCVSTAGKELWKGDLGPMVRSGRPGFGGEGGANPSSSTDGKAVYAFAANGDFAAFDFTGKELWRFNAQERYGKFRIQFGIQSTPVLHGDRLYLQLLHDGGQKVACLDKADGKEKWAIDRESDGRAENKHGYTSPFIWKKGKEAYLVVHGNDYTTAHELKDGAEIWRVGDLNPKGRYNPTLRFVASPVCLPDLIVIPTAKQQGVVGLKPGAKGKVNKGDKSEQWRLARGTPDVPSPLVHDGIVYLVGEGGSLTTLDAKTGKEIYKKQVNSDTHWASPVYADGKIYIQSWGGTTSVVQAGKDYKVLARNTLDPDDTTLASPVISGGRIYLRGYKTLWAIEEKK